MGIATSLLACWKIKLDWVFLLLHGVCVVAANKELHIQPCHGQMNQVRHSTARKLCITRLCVILSSASKQVINHSNFSMHGSNAICNASMLTKQL